MSVKFEKETIKQTGGIAGTQGIATMTPGKHHLAEEIGTALTGGKGSVGTKGYLAVRLSLQSSNSSVSTWSNETNVFGLKAYLEQLQKNPLRTKMLTSGTLSAFQELLASYIAKDRNKNGGYMTARVPKMAAYGAFISAPLGHILISILQKAFAGRTSLRAKILQIIASNLIVRIDTRTRTLTIVDWYLK